MPKKTRTARATRRPVTAGGTPRIHVYLAVSLDGCIATPPTAADPGGVAWLDPYSDAMAGYAAFIRTIGAAIMGRATYDFAAGQAWMLGKMPAHVLTHRPLPPGAPPTVSTFAGDVGELARRLRAQTRGDIWHMGGGRSIQAFLEQDLVDLWTVFVIPTILGAGPRLFLPMTPRVRALRLAKTRAFPSGVVELRYRRAP